MAHERELPGAVLGDVPGTDEVPVVNWPRLWRQRLRHRIRRGDRYRWWVLVTSLTGLFATGFTITVLAVSVGEIADDLGSTETALSWIVTGPLLALALAMPLLGKLGDVHGHRRVYLVGFGVFTAITALTPLAQGAAALIALRVAAALAGAATGPTSMALIMSAFPESDRVKAMGWWSLVGAGAPVFGLVAGGPVVELFGWRWIFVAQAPIAALALVLAATVLHETPRRPRVPLDVAGAAFLAVAAVSALLALSQGRTWGWASTGVVGLFLLAPVALAAFVRAERRAAHPLLPLEFFGRVNFTPSLVAQFGSNFAYMGGFFVTPLLLRDVLGWGVATTGYLMLCRPLTFSLSSPVAGYATVRVGERTAAVFGTSLVVVSMLVFALAAAGRSIPLLVVGLVLSGLGLGASSPSLVSSVANAVDTVDLGVANAAQQTVAQIGTSAGIQVLVTIQASSDGSGPFVVAYLVGAVLAATAVVAATRIRSLTRAGAVGVDEVPTAAPARRGAIR